MKQYMLSLMRDQRCGIIHIPVKFILSIISIFYGVIIKTWNFCYDKGIFRTHLVNAKVISVGSISLGGSGKTPFVLFLANYLKKQNKHLSVLIRGYGDDEWRVLDKNLDSIPVIKGRDRVKTAKESVELCKPHVIILDDGFQHRRLKRDLDIVLVDSHEGFGNRKLFPRGTLREFPSSIKRADIVVLTKADFGKENIRNLRILLSGKYKKHKSLEAIYRPLWFTDLNGEIKRDINSVCSKKVCVVSAIANASYLKYMLKNMEVEIVQEIEYPDHHDYTQDDIEAVQKKANEAGCDYIITTEKDAVKIKKLPLDFTRDKQSSDSKINILVLHVKLEITKGMEELVDRLNSIFCG